MTKTSEAAERLRRLQRGEAYYDIYRPLVDSDDELLDDMDADDRALLADAWLAEHDDYPIDETWLNENFGRRENIWGHWHFGNFSIAHCFGWHLSRIEPLVNVNNIKARGQLRLLLRALNPERGQP